MTPGGDDNSIRCGKNNPFARAVVYKDQEYPTLKSFCEKYDLKISTVSSWLNGHIAMPVIFYEGNLHYKNENSNHTFPQRGHAFGKNCGTSKRIYFKDKEYDTLKEFCDMFHVDKGSVRNWTSGKTSMPQFFYDNNLHYENEDMSNAVRRTRKDKYTYADPM